VRMFVCFLTMCAAEELGNRFDCRFPPFVQGLIARQSRSIRRREAGTDPIAACALPRYYFAYLPGALRSEPKVFIELFPFVISAEQLTTEWACKGLATTGQGGSRLAKTPRRGLNGAQEGGRFRRDCVWQMRVAQGARYESTPHHHLDLGARSHGDFCRRELRPSRVPISQPSPRGFRGATRPAGAVGGARCSDLAAVPRVFRVTRMWSRTSSRFCFGGASSTAAACCGRSSGRLSDERQETAVRFDATSGSSWERRASLSGSVQPSSTSEAPLCVPAQPTLTCSGPRAAVGSRRGTTSR
jgi:hypothetical protein